MSSKKQQAYFAYRRELIGLFNHAHELEWEGQRYRAIVDIGQVTKAQRCRLRWGVRRRLVLAVQAYWPWFSAGTIEKPWYLTKITLNPEELERGDAAIETGVILTPRRTCEKATPQASASSADKVGYDLGTDMAAAASRSVAGGADAGRIPRADPNDRPSGGGALAAGASDRG